METAAIPPPAEVDAGVVFIGRIRTPFRTRADCPRNVRIAREGDGSAVIEVDAAYRVGLDGLERYSHVVVLYWMDEAERDLLVQHPRHASGPRGVFSIRSPARPNPIAMAVARLIGLDAGAGTLTIEQLDCRDGTPLLDIKPYFPSIDSAPEATVAD
jgi:tRNA (adenine37-N6)-methyltransferase